MRAITTIFLDHSLSAILEYAEETSGNNPDVPDLVEFKATLRQQIRKLRNEDSFAASGEDICAA